MGAVVLFAKVGKDFLLNFITPSERETGVKEGQVLLWHNVCLFERFVHLLSALHGVADDRRAATLAQFAGQ